MRYRDGEEIYVNNSAQYAFTYYYIYHGFYNRSVYVGKITDDFRMIPTFVPHEDVEYLEWFFNPKGGYFFKVPPKGKSPGILTKGKDGEERRVWLIFAHAYPPHKQEILEYFNARGRQLDQFHAEGASLYQYAI